MSLRAIVAALGGELYSAGRRAQVPAPGHSRADRSVSLLLDGDRVVVHGFGAADWREVRDHLRDLGLIDADGRLSGEGAPAAARLDAAARPSPCARTAAARDLWAGAFPLAPGDLCQSYFQMRRIPAPETGVALRRHPDAPVSVFRRGGSTCPALVAAVTAPAGMLSAVEVAYLDPEGRPARRLRLPRKTVGLLPPGSAVRLRPAAETMLVGEGVATTLSAIARFALPGWALLSAGNLAAWSPPAGTRRILIAADRGRAGEASAARLRGRLQAAGLKAQIRLPPRGFGDWNEAAS